ncbi:MAG TPA: hypothetical protein VIJ51_17990 [Solirubrobacteraceae bacterium]
MGLLRRTRRLRGWVLSNVGLVAAALVLAPAATGVPASRSAAGGTAGPKAPAGPQAPAGPKVPPVATVAPAPPGVKSGPADELTYQSARLKGEVNPGGQATAYFFLYGPTPAYGSQSLTVSLEAGGRAVTVFTQLAGLQPLTGYHYSLVAINALGTRFGADETFTTAAAPLTLMIGASANPAILGVPVSIFGQTVGTGAPGSAVVLQANPFPFTGGFQIVGSPGLASSAGTFSFDVGPVALSTQFRVVSVGPGQPLVSDTLTEFVRLAVTTTVTRSATSGGGTATTFAGTISPAEVGARVSVQRMVAGRWTLVAATKAQATTIGGASYSIALHLNHSGSYRVYSASVEGGHLASAGEPVTVHVHGGFGPSTT